MSLHRVTRITPRPVSPLPMRSAVTLDRVITWSGRDRLERTVVIAAIGLLATVTGISIWAQQASRRQVDVTTSHVRAVQAAQVSASDLVNATSKAARRRATARTMARLSP